MGQGGPAAQLQLPWRPVGEPGPRALGVRTACDSAPRMGTAPVLMAAPLPWMCGGGLQLQHSPQLVCPSGWEPAKHGRLLSPVCFPGASWATALRRNHGQPGLANPSSERILYNKERAGIRKTSCSLREKRGRRRASFSSRHWENAECKTEPARQCVHRPQAPFTGPRTREVGLDCSPELRGFGTFCCTCF